MQHSNKAVPYPLSGRGFKGRLSGVFGAAAGFARKHPQTIAVAGVAAIAVVGLLGRGRRCR